MALNKTQIPISFNGGIDTKTDDKQVMATKLLELENGIFGKKGSLQKRHGYDILRSTILEDSTSLTEATGITTFKDQLLMFTGKKLYNYIEASTAWTLKGTSSSVINSNRSIIRNIYQQTDVDYAYNSGISVYAWKDSSGGSRYSVLDETSGTVIQSNQLLSLTAEKPRVIGLGRYIFVLYIDGTTIKLRTIQITTPQIISASTDLTTNVDPVDKIYDAQLTGNRIFVGYNHNAGGGAIALFYITSSKVVSSEVFVVGDQATGGISLAGDGSSNIWMSWYNGTAVKYAIWTYALDVTGGGGPTILGPTVLETIANVRNIASILTSTLVTTFLYEISNAAGNFIKENTGSLSGTVGTPVVFVRSVGLASKLFNYNGEFYFTTVFGSPLQSTYFVYSLNKDIITKMDQDVGGSYTVSSILPTPVQISPGKFVIPNLKKGIILTQDGTAFTSIGVNSTLVDFVSLNNFITTELGNNLQVVGGVLQSYDGVSINEAGFNVFPEGVTSSLVSPGTGNIPNGTYQYSVVYSWFDNQGQQHRSAPSIGLQVVVSGGPSNVQLIIPTLRITKKQDVFIEVYRTEAAGTIFYKITSNTALTLNNPTVDTITYADTKTDAQIISGEILYTVSGELDNIAPPPASVIVNWKNRIVLKSTEEENLLLFSKIRQEGKPVEFSDQLTISVDPRGGDVSALGVLDDKLIIFKQTSIHFQAGDGPNNLGEQSDFGLPQLITADAGCIDVNSVVQTPVGLIFKSEKGIYLLDRSLSVQYIGAEVEKFNSHRITAGKLISDANQIRFTTADNFCLVYDYYFQQWSTFTNHEAVGATIYQDKFCFVKSNAQVYKENDTSFKDGSQRIKMKIVSAWMNIAELQGYQRFYKLILLGTYKSKHRLKVKFGYNFNTSFTQEVEINISGTINPTTYGEDTPYGNEDVYGGQFPLYQWRVFPQQQKCQTFRISIEDIMDDVFDESFSISNLRLEVGIKQGSNKLGTDRSVGSA